MTSLEVHRTAKLFLEEEGLAGEEEALRRLGDFSVSVMVGNEIRHSRNKQAALLTVVNAGARTFLGGVFVVGLSDERLLLDLPGELTLAKTIEYYGGLLAKDPSPGSVLLLIGDVEPPAGWQGRTLRISWERWYASVCPEDYGCRGNEDDEFPPAAIYAAAVSLGEAFQYIRGSNVQAARRPWELSLYRPDFRADPKSQSGPDQPLLLPEKLWIIGLGHLGQAYLWNLLCLRYPVYEKPLLVLQDVDVLSAATLSTGLLSRPEDLGKKKTVALRRLLIERGLNVDVVERRFDGVMQLQDKEPRRALSGLDNQRDRALLENAGFEEIIDAGLGSRGEHFLDYQLRVLPSTVAATRLFPPAEAPNHEALLDKPAYQAIIDIHGRCGVLEIAGKAVGAPFVGAAVGALVIAEAIRSTMNGPRYFGMNGSLRTQEGSRAEWNHSPSLRNLGYIPALNNPE